MIIFAFVTWTKLTAVIELLLMGAFNVPLQITPFSVNLVADYTLMASVTVNALAIVCVANSAI